MPFVRSDQIQDLKERERATLLRRNKRTQYKNDGQKGGSNEATNYTSVQFVSLFIYLFKYFIAYQPMGNIRFPMRISERSRFLALHIVPHRSRMRSHVFLVADLIDSYRSPRCIIQNMAFVRFFKSLIPRTPL